MSTKTENLRFAMYRQLEALRKARKQPVALQDFESKLEEYLGGLSVDHTALVESLQHNLALYQDAYEQQKTLTRNALVYNREHYDELYQLRNQVKELKYNAELAHDKLQESTAKLASGSESIRALLRVVKSQQNACRRLQRLLMTCVKERQQDRTQSHREIMQAEAISDERWELLEAKQKTIVSQRKRIEQLESDLLLSRNPSKRHGFWLFWMRKSTKAKILPEKTI